MAHPITVPRLGWSMEQGTFLGWKKKDGDFVRAGEVLFELEGEKAAQEIESLDSGILRIPPDAPKEGAVVPVGALLGYLVAEGETIPLTQSSSQDTPSAQPAEMQKAIPRQPVASPAVRRRARELGVNLSSLAGAANGGRVTAEDIRTFTSTAPPTARSRVVASPRARRVAKELGVDWKALAGSGKSGRIRERDVLAAAQNGTGSRTQRIPLSPRRRTIAARMAASIQQTAPVTLTTRADATNLVTFRNQFKTGGADIIPTYTDLFVKLSAAALLQHPLLLARWKEDYLELPAGIHIGIAVDCDEGLMVPVIRNVPALSLPELAQRSRELVDRARAGSLKADELQGGVFTITNLGAFGIDAFTPIINLPETAILGVGCIRREPAVVDDQIVPREQVALSLTFDHRIVDGAPAARFLQTIRDAVENPSTWLPQ